MNKTFSITLTILSIVAIIATLFFRQANATVLNQNFSIEALYGDPALINDIFEISTVRQEGTNNFSRVVLTTNEPVITPIAFDARHHLNERQLENREFYRGTHWWARHNPVETENFRLISVDNWPNADILNILDKQTGDFLRIEDTTNRDYFNSWTMRFFIEQGNKLYIVITDEGTPTARVYTVDFQNETLNHELTIHQESEAAGSWFATENNIYFYEMGGWIQLPGQSWVDWVDNPSHATGGWDPDTGQDTLTPSERTLYALNFDTQTFDLRPSPIGVSSWAWSQAQWGDYVILEGILSMEGGEQGHFDGFSIINFESGQRHVFPNTTVSDWIGTQQGHSLHTSHRTDIHIIADYLIETTRINNFLQFIAIYDLTTLTQIYHGRIDIRRDQGLLTNDWGEIYGFEVRLRD